MGAVTQGLSPVVSELDELVDHLDGVRARVASAYAAEVHFFAAVAGVVQRRERERAGRIDEGARVDASQLAMREVYAEIAAALRLSEYQVAVRVGQAHTLVHEFTETFYDLSDGRLSAQHAQAIADAGAPIRDAGVRGEYERLALGMAQELTAAQLKVALGSVVDRLDPEGTQERIRAAVAERGVRKRTVGPGLGQLVITAPITEVEGAYTRLSVISDEIHADNQAETAEQAAAQALEQAAEQALDQAAVQLLEQADAGTGGAGGRQITDAHAAGGAGAGVGGGFVADDRTRAQIMADIALDLLLTSAPDGHGATEERRTGLGAIRATVHITIPAATLTGAGTGGAEITGAGPIDDDTARALAAGADAWYRFFTDPATGVPVSVDRRRPCKAQRRLLRARDEQCRFPGCRRPARTSDIDHQLAWADGGPTSLDNLAHLCERHHTVKHHTDWEVQHLPGGILRWTAPTHRTHTTRPPGAIRYVPDRPHSAIRFVPDRPPRPAHEPAPF